jgi:uncharacterized protein
MKRAVILHGTSGSPDYGWLPWLKRELQKNHYDVFAPLLPHNDKPNRHTYETFIKNSGWDFSENIIVGHSSGATTVLNLLSSDWFPSVKTSVLIGTFLNEKLLASVEWYVPGQFDDLFLDKYDPTIIKQKSDNFYFVHGSNDPYCDIRDAKKLCEQVDGTFIKVENGHHLGELSGFSELPSLIEKLKSDKKL